jgi:outer membrane receptor protein involved in Fe transport
MEGQQMRLSYSKRVNRPRLWQLDPVDDNEDPTFRRVGNPFLGPEYVHAFELSYVRHWEALTLTTSPYFRRTVNEIQWRERFDPSGVTILTFENAASSNSYGAELIAALSLNRRLRGNLSVNTYRVVTDASNLDTDLSHDAMVYSGRANLIVTPRTGLDLQLSQFYRSPVDIAGGQMGARSMMTIGAKQELFDGKASIGLQARDVLNTMGFDLTRRDASFYQETSRDWGGRQVSVSVAYTFGQPKKKGRDRDRRGGGDDFGDLEMQ